MARLFTAKDTVHDLMDRAQELLDEEEPGKALKIGQELERRCFSGAFEIQALALVAMDRLKEAIETLKRGVSLAPQAWVLWQQLGNCQSDAGLYASALHAYDAALQVEGADPVQLAYNAAEAMFRAGHADAAEERLAPALAAIDDADADRRLSLVVIGLHLKLLNERAAYAQALAFRPEAPDDRDRDDHPDEAAYLLSRRGVARLRLGDAAAARSFALAAIALDKGEETAQWLLRELGKARDFSKARYYRLLVEGVWPWDGGGRGFFASYDVMADDEAEALSLVSEFEPAPLRRRLKVSKAEILERAPQPKGVYRAARGYTLFPLESE